MIRVWNYVKYNRKRKKMTQIALAKLCNISRVALQNIENDYVDMHLSVALKIAKHLNCNLYDLYFIDDKYFMFEDEKENKDNN